MHKYFKILNIILAAMAMLMFFLIGFQAGKRYDIVLDENNDYLTISYSVNEQKMRRLMSLIDNYYVDSINTNQLVDKTIDFVTQNLDPHTTYIPKRLSAIVEQEIKGYYDGIGIHYIIYKDSAMLLGTTPNSPNQNLFKLGDRILSVNHKKIDSINIDSLDFFTQGKENTFVSLQLLRNGEKVNVKAKRTKISLSPITLAYMLHNHIGYIKLSRFSENAAEDFHNALSSLKKRGMTALIFDLRGNPGGLVDEAQKIADEFLKENQLIVYTKDRRGTKKFRYATKNGLFEGKPVYILIDGNSASASEIVAGAIQDQDAGVIIGRRSYGKGLVQREINLGDGSKIRLTMAKYYTPTGRCIQKPYKINTEEYRKDLQNRLQNGELFSVDSIKKIDSLKFKTKKGKIVYGGGGIIPDVFIPLDTIGIGRWFYENGYANSLQPSILKFIDTNHVLLSQIKEEDFINSYDTEPFTKEIIKHLKPENPKEELKLKNLNILIKSIIAKLIYGDEAYDKIWNTIDPMILKAEALDETK